MAKRNSLFQVAYGSIYLLLYIILLGLLLITPADAIERSLRNGQHYNVWLLIFAYVFTIVVVVFIYFVRLYVNRTDLASIPKAWIPIEAGDVKKRVHSVITHGLDRSAAIAYEARPREAKQVLGREWTRPDSHEAHDLQISRPLQDVLWRNIEHNGWASPNSPDLPNLKYSTVISELPNLIEAKALTLAPRSPNPQGVEEPPLLDAEAVALLQRAPGLSLRGYIDHLGSLGVLGVSETSVAFLQQYEHARFSTRSISNVQFRELMHLFAEVLRSMEPLDLEAALRDMSTTSSLSDYDDGGGGGGGGLYIAETGPSATSQSLLSRSATVSTQNSVRRPLRAASWGQQYQTAPNTPRSKKQQQAMSRKSSRGSVVSSSNSFSQTRRPYDPSTSSPSSGRSQSVRSRGSSSVIRLATREDDESLPYVLNLSGTFESFNAVPR
jgi:hypothetical protein